MNDPPYEDDVAGTVRILGEHFGQEGDAIIYVPTPSPDPNDPLNWSMPRKWTLLACVTL